MDQLYQILLQLSQARRRQGVSERDGTIHQVWRQNGEQKVRVNIGMRPDGSPWLTPWLKVEDHHGSHRIQRKFHQGMNVKVSTVGGDMRNATVTPHGENVGHPEPDHADDYNETRQYARHRTRIGPDFSEYWLANQDQQYQQELLNMAGVETSDLGSQDQAASGNQDPDQQGVVLVRTGQKPQQQQSQNGPWSGPPPNGGNPQKRHLIYAGQAGNAPNQSGDAVASVFDTKTKSERTEDHILHVVQSGDGQKFTVPGMPSGINQITSDFMSDGSIVHTIQSNLFGTITTAIHQNGFITHKIQDMMGNISTFTQQARQMMHMVQGNDGFSLIAQDGKQIMGQVGNTAIQLLQEMMNLNANQININSMGISTFSSPPIMPGVNAAGYAPLLLPIPIFANLVPEADLLVYLSGPWYLTPELSGSANLFANLDNPHDAYAGFGPLSELSAYLTGPWHINPVLSSFANLSADLSGPWHISAGLSVSGDLSA